ncbi:MAG: squalene/phytoene synthase family protein, partial [Ignavibacteria bacterium]|nr:squalene/phytoene synthase family protein [Ignavibacteria bacterium]
MNKRLLELISIKRKSNFLSTFIFLPKEKRRAMNIVYDFCSITDDIVDTNQCTLESKIELLGEWRTEFNQSLLQRSDISLLNKFCLLYTSDAAD